MNLREAYVWYRSEKDRGAAPADIEASEDHLLSCIVDAIIGDVPHVSEPTPANPTAPTAPVQTAMPAPSDAVPASRLVPGGVTQPARAADVSPSGDAILARLAQLLERLDKGNGDPTDAEPAAPIGKPFGPVSPPERGTSVDAPDGKPAAPVPADDARMRAVAITPQGKVGE